MFDPTTIVNQIVASGFTHVVWIPDSSLGPWENALQATLPVIRPTREGEAIGIAIGLMLGGAKPLVIMQCTGLFEAGDALRNAVHDLRLPLKLLVGIRSYQAFLAGKTGDNCPTFTEPIIRTWNIPYRLLATPTQADLLMTLQELGTATTPFALLVGE